MAVPADRIFDPAGRLQIVAALLPVTLVGLLVFAALYVFTAGAPVSRRRKRAAAILHTVLHLAVVVGVVDLLLQLSGVAAGDPWMRAVLGGAVGALLGPLVVAVYLWIADHFRVNSNELYAGCANEAYKNFLRLHVDRTGLTVYPIGVRLPTGWTFGSDAPHEAPRRSDGARQLGRAAVVPARGCDRARADREAHPHTATAPLRPEPAGRPYLTTYRCSGRSDPGCPPAGIETAGRAYRTVAEALRSMWGTPNYPRCSIPAASRSSASSARIRLRSVGAGARHTPTAGCRQDGGGGHLVAESEKFALDAPVAPGRFSRAIRCTEGLLGCGRPAAV